MLKIKFYTEGDGEYYIRILPFDEFEFTYTSGSFSEIKEIDIKSTRNHLQVDSNGGELKVLDEESGKPVVMTEKVLSMQIKGETFNPSQLNEIGNAILSMEDKKDRGDNDGINS